MFVVYVGSILTTILWSQRSGRQGRGAGRLHSGRRRCGSGSTLLFANFAEAIAEGRSKAQAASLRERAQGHVAKKLARAEQGAPSTPTPVQRVCARATSCCVEQGDLVPGDGEVIEGAPPINESAITGESAPVIRDAGSDFNSVTGGTRVLSDWIIVRINVNPGEAFLDRMIAMVEGAKRQKTPNEIALTILLVAMTLVFLLATVTLLPYSIYSVEVAKAGTPVTITVLVALLVCLIPTTIGGLLSAIGVAGMGRMMRANVIATSGPRGRGRRRRATCCCSTRPARSRSATARRRRFTPAPGVTEQRACRGGAARLAGDETPEGSSIVVLAKQKFGSCAPPLEPGHFSSSRSRRRRA